MKNKVDQTKTSKSVLVHDQIDEPDFYEKDGKIKHFRENSPTKVVTNKLISNSFLRPITPTIVHNEGNADDEFVLPDFASLQSVKKTKSFNMNSIKNNLNGKKKRFSVMKVVPDDIREKAVETAKSIAESVFLESDKKLGESVFNVPDGMHRVIREVMVKQEIINLKHKIFSIETCRYSALDFDENEQTMRVIEKTDDVEIIEIRRKFVKKQQQLSEQGEESLKQSNNKNDVSVTTSADSNPSAEIGGMNKPINRVYYITRILNDDNIYIIFLEYDQKNKILIDNHYFIIAIGEKKLYENEEYKMMTHSFDSNTPNNEDQEITERCLEINFIYSKENESNEQSDGEAICNILQEMIENTEV